VAYLAGYCYWLHLNFYWGRISMKLFEIVFGDGSTLIQFSETRRNLRLKFAGYIIREINRVEIH
jgi:hypothetical protein